MSRLFGALANAAAKYGEGRFKRKAYDDGQAQQSLENERRAFEFAANQGRLTEQMNLVKQQREDQLQRQREGDVVDAQQSGYETAAPEAIGAAANAYLQSQGMGGPGSAGVVRAPNTAPKKYELEGQTFGDDTQPGRQMQYATVGGRMMRYDPQRKINDETRKAFEGYTKELTMKRDVAQQNQAARDEAAKDRAITVEQIRAASRPQPQPRAQRTQLVQGADGEYVIVDLDQLGPTGLKGPPKGTTGGAKITSSDRNRLLGVQNIVRSAADAKAATDGVDGFAGPVDVPMQRAKTFLGQPDPKITAAQRAWQRLASPAARAEIGTAMTPQEIKRLDKWLPLLESTDESVIREGIAGFEREAKQIWQENLDVMRASGMDMSEFEKLPAKWGAGQQGGRPSPRQKLRLDP